MNIETAVQRNLEHRGGQKKPVGGHNQRVRPQFAQSYAWIALPERYRFLHGYAELARLLRNFARRNSHPATGATIGLRQYEGDLMPSGHDGLEGMDGEGRSTREYDSQGREAGVRLPCVGVF